MPDFSPAIAPIVERLTSCEYDAVQMRRIFHGRGHTYDGLDFMVLDWYPPVLFVALFRPVEDDWLASLCDALWQHKPDGASAMVVQKRQGADTQAQVVYGELPNRHIGCEGEAKYHINLNNSQNIGIFIDMINGRQWVKEHCHDKNVLNLFAYTCAFSVVALQGGAKQVVNVDMNKSVMATGRKNHQLNQLDSGKAKFFTHNIFNSWGKIKRHGLYDMVIIDPPSFQKGSFVLTKDYQRLIKRLPELAATGADVLLCLNSPDVGTQYLLDLVAEHCPALQFIERLVNHPDFPELDEQKSLKVLRFVMGESV